MGKSAYKDMWAYIEHDGARAADVGLELCCELRRLCDRSGDKLLAVVVGSLPDGELQRVKDCGVDGLILVNRDERMEYNTEAYTEIFARLANKYRPSAIFVGGTWGKHTRMGTRLSRYYKRGELDALVEKAILWFRENAFVKERLGAAIDRVGVEAFEAAIATDDLLARKDAILAAPLKERKA